MDAKLHLGVHLGVYQPQMAMKQRGVAVHAPQVCHDFAEVACFFHRFAAASINGQLTRIDSATGKFQRIAANSLAKEPIPPKQPPLRPAQN